MIQLLAYLMLDGIELPSDMHGKGPLPINVATGGKEKHQNT